MAKLEIILVLAQQRIQLCFKFLRSKHDMLFAQDFFRLLPANHVVV